MWNDQLKKLTTAKLVQESGNNANFSNAHAVYTTVFSTGCTITIAEFIDENGERELNAIGFTLESADFSVFDDLSPCEFDSLAKYEAFVRKEKIRMQKLKVINPDDRLLETCNYKGECMGFVLATEIINLPLYQSKNESFNAFNI